MPRHEPADYDVPMQEALEHIYTLHKLQVSTILLEWTCPSCGERPAMVLENIIDHARHLTYVKVPTDGMLHTEKADGSFCGVHVKMAEWRVSVIGLSTIGS